MPIARRFSSTVLRAVRDGKIVWLRSGDEHRFTGVWVVVVNDRVFVRSWNNKATGWYRAFADEPRGTMRLASGRELPVRARRARGERLQDAVDAAYAEKYTTKASRKYVLGFRRARRRATTTELRPV